MSAGEKKHTPSGGTFPALILMGLCIGMLPVRGIWAAGTADTPAQVNTPSQANTGLPGNGEKPPPPRWVRDLRRGEIIAFGSFPFTFFTSTFIMDTRRYYHNNRDTRYAPWPFKSAGAVNMTKDEHLIVIGSAAGGAVLLAVADFVVQRIKRHNDEKKAAGLPPGEPIIIRTPRPQTEPPGVPREGKIPEEKAAAEVPEGALPAEGED